MKWQGRLENIEDIKGIHNTPANFSAGYAVGIIAVNLVYPKLPGNVANATTYPFPVIYKEVNFEIEKLFEGDESIKDIIINAARELESVGVRTVIGACGYFAHFQREVANAVNIPVFLSSLCQLPLIKLSLSEKKKIAVIAASGENISNRLLANVGSDLDRLIVKNIGSLPSFEPIRWGKTQLDNGRLESDLCREVEELTESNPDIGAILLECSDLPPYAKSIQSVTGLPVFDFNSMIDMVYHGVVQKNYFGYF